ncbi:MAG: 23S rRNA (guanosine(2251)-2'-O)-methyltransferase RlmB [Firmicutes bacterium]|nr:23S rRNA (guanosine(2251)-2'-O)-methyltransferase RlmB [Bacillota bacterium]
MNEEGILYGRHPVLEGLRGKTPFEKIYISQHEEPSEILKEIRRTAEFQGIPVLFAHREKLNQITRNGNHQGVVGIASAQEYVSLEKILKTTAGKTILLALDHIEDPQNLGAVLRTCDAVGVKGVILPKRRSTGLTGGAAKASAGAIRYVPVARVSNLHQALLTLRKNGFLILGADQSAEKSYREISYPDQVVLVMGNEHKGLSFLIKNNCDLLVKIPMTGHLDSLNVSAAASLILYEIFFKFKSLETAES